MKSREKDEKRGRAEIRNWKVWVLARALTRTLLERDMLEQGKFNVTISTLKLIVLLFSCSLCKCQLLHDTWVNMISHTEKSTLNYVVNGYPLLGEHRPDLASFATKDKISIWDHSNIPQHPNTYGVHIHRIEAFSAHLWLLFAHWVKLRVLCNHYLSFSINWLFYRSI